MACVDKMPKVIAESEMEEGEIVDDLDDLSDISSEEEFLLRQRLEVLENYNNVLERKKAKRSSLGPGIKPKKRDVLCDLSEVSAAELEDPHSHITYKQMKVQRHVKPHNKEKRKKDIHITSKYADENNVRKKKEYQKKKTMRTKKRLGVKIISESSDESEDEYRNKRKKLADAVIVPRGKSDKSSLSARLHKMIHGSEAHINAMDGEHKESNIISNNHDTLTEETFSPISSVNADDPVLNVPQTVLKDKDKTVYELIEVSTDDDVKIISNVECEEKIEVEKTKPEEDTKECETHREKDKDSDEDLELLRQHALESKPSKSKTPESNKTENKVLSEDEDSDTAELRLICLKSALLKKAIEMKQKQKLQKKLSQSSNLEDDLFNDANLFPNKEDSDNNTDIESVDMDMGSDVDEKLKDCNGESDKQNNTGLNVRLHDSSKNKDLINGAINNLNVISEEDELDDDEDLLRAKLLTSLSKNLTNLVSPEILNAVDKNKEVENSAPQTANKTVKTPEAKKFIIKLDGSDSEGEHEATKNLKKMHMKLSEQIDFQEKLDLFLKSTRMEVEKTKLPDVVQKPPVPKKPDKYVAKAVTHLPKSEQIEYKNLVRRMAELEKMKQTRQATLNLLKQPLPMKDSLKQRNVTIDTQAANDYNLEEQIAKSRKTIAEESAKMLKLKEEATKLSQKYKIAATELRNISTAITLNRKQQRAIQISLSKIRSQHQSLLRSSSTLHSKVNGRIPHLSHLSNKVLSNKSQKENNPKEEYKNPQVQKTVKVSVVNDFVDKAIINNPRMSVELDIASNKKVVKLPKSPEAVADRIAEVNQNVQTETEEVQKLEEKNRRLSESNNEQGLLEDNREHTDNNTELVAVCDHGNKRYYISVDDYRSPLDALGSTTWQGDPNAILCPFEVGGQCKDCSCKYLHTLTSAQ